MSLPEEKIILYRVDGNFQMGLGHIFRARSLCKCLKSMGMRPVILTLSEDYVAEEINGWGVDILRINGLNRQEINEYVIDRARQFNSPILIQDIRDTNAEDMAALKSENIIVINFDDLGSGRDYADILIDANLEQTCDDTDKKQLRLFGKKYMVLDPQYADFNKKTKIINPYARKLVVSMGGTDPRNLTGWVIRNLLRLIVAHETEVDIIIGKGTANKDELEYLSAKAGFNCFYNVKNLAEQLFDADLAVISGGITLYEAACAGTPSIVLPQVEHQTQIARRFESEGIAVCPFDETQTDIESFTHAIKKLCADYDLRLKMSERGKKTVDGEGANRISKVISDIYSTCLHKDVY